MSSITVSQKSSKKRKASDKSFEEQLLSRFDMLQGENNDEYDDFGKEVAIGVKCIDGCYEKHLVMREIRDILFKARFKNNTFTPLDNYSKTFTEL